MCIFPTLYTRAPPLAFFLTDSELTQAQMFTGLNIKQFGTDNNGRLIIKDIAAFLQKNGPWFRFSLKWMTVQSTSYCSNLTKYIFI